MILFYADHGHHVNVFHYIWNIKSLDLELKLPLFSLMLPRNLTKTYGKILKENEQKVVGGYDIYNFLQTVSGKNEYAPQGKNLLEVIPANRTCDDLEDRGDFGCVCHPKTKNELINL